MSRRRQRLGRIGELLAACYLRCKGYRILARNLDSHLAQIDLIAQDGQVLVICEVKLRRGPVRRWIDEEQKRRLRRAAKWLHRQTRGRARGVRIDLVLISWPRAKHFWQPRLPRFSHLRAAIADDDDVSWR